MKFKINRLSRSVHGKVQIVFSGRAHRVRQRSSASLHSGKMHSGKMHSVKMHFQSPKMHFLRMHSPRVHSNASTFLPGYLSALAVLSSQNEPV